MSFLKNDKMEYPHHIHILELYISNVLRTTPHIKHDYNQTEMNKKINDLYEIISNSFDNSEIHKEIMIDLPEIRTVMINGPRGVGKKTLVQKVNKKISANLFSLSLSSVIIQHDYLENVELFREENGEDNNSNSSNVNDNDNDGDDDGNSNNPIRSIFKKAIKSAPSIILLKDLDVLAKENYDQILNSFEWRSKVINILKKELQNIYHIEKIFIIGLTCNATKLPESIRKIDFFQHQMHLDVPTRVEREEILRHYFLNLKVLSSNIIEEFTMKLGLMTSGYVVRDLKRLVRLAVLHSLREPMQLFNNGDNKDFEDLFEKLSLQDSLRADNDNNNGNHNDDNNDDGNHSNNTDDGGNDGNDERDEGWKLNEKLKKWKLKWNDFEYAHSTMKPSHSLEFETMIPYKLWSEIGGYDNIKLRLKQIIDWPINHSDTFNRLGIKPTSGLLLYGPSGCGKTILVQALVCESRMNAICVKGPSIYSKYFGETENVIRNLFKTARKISPCIIFFDEMDSIAAKRDWPINHSDTFNRLGIKPTSGLLLYGPSGCGKTILVQALVCESRMNAICVKGPSIYSKYFGETENVIRNLFKTARKISPCIIFFDEMDSIAAKRGWDYEDSSGVNERVLSTLLNEMDGIQELKDVLVIGCTNRPDRIDDAILRPGRIDQLLYVGYPTKQDQINICKVISQRMAINQDEIDFDKLTDELEEFTNNNNNDNDNDNNCNGFSGADFEILFRESALTALRENIEITQISMCHIRAVFDKMRKTKF
ncbi:hypothetical protein Glove_350g123 [Diversispora epigaea]|uniref:AAA+ ATPase domain-containing protein n=1 Tax=Diversispora epigaea TaxID=1348612 RepID=A0A397HHL8_9GLOM|nr:hypothetical protein Glove_350g123 [Diversispora epigaea]